MKLSIHDKTMLIEALYLAEMSDSALIDAHANCPDDAEIKDKCRRNIKFFNALRKRMEKARKYHTTISS